MKETIDTYCPKLIQIMNVCLKNNFFLDGLKGPEINPSFKKGDKSEKENHNLLVAKLKAYGLDLNAALFIKSSLTNRYQRCRIGNSFSEWEILIAGVPQGSILGHLLFNIFINNIFLYIENSYLCNYADDSTLYVSGEYLYLPIFQEFLDGFTKILWFSTLINIILWY